MFYGIERNRPIFSSPFDSRLPRKPLRGEWVGLCREELCTITRFLRDESLHGFHSPQPGSWAPVYPQPRRDYPAPRRAAQWRDPRQDHHSTKPPSPPKNSKHVIPNPVRLSNGVRNPLAPRFSPRVPHPCGFRKGGDFALIPLHQTGGRGFSRATTAALDKSDTDVRPDLQTR